MDLNCKDLIFLSLSSFVTNKSLTDLLFKSMGVQFGKVCQIFFFLNCILVLVGSANIAGMFVSVFYILNRPMS